MRQMLGNDVDCHAARDLARLVSAHAVGEHGESELRVRDDAVLVFSAHAAGMRQAAHHDVRRVLHVEMLARYGVEEKVPAVLVCPKDIAAFVPRFD